VACSGGRYLYDHLVRFLQPFPNAWCTGFRLGTVWGAANLYEMYIKGALPLTLAIVLAATRTRPLP